MPNYSLYRIRKACSQEQSQLLNYFDNLTPENFHLMNEYKKNYSDCVKTVKAQLLKENQLETASI